MHILIIEDNQGIAKLISEVLSDEGYITDVAAGGNEAIAAFENKLPDMFILDYSLPDMDGKQLVTILNERFGKLPPFIVSTGRGDEQVAVDMMKLGAYDYLIKGPSLTNRLPEVVSKISKDIEIKRLLNEAEIALKESENRFRSFVENSSDLFVKLSEERNIVYVSPNSKELLGYENTELMGKSVYDFITPENITKAINETDQIILNTNNTSTLRYKINHRDGGIRFHSAKGVMVVENGQKFINFVVRDITEKTFADNRILNAIIQTEENQRKLFAEELHEGIGPNLSTLKLYMDRIRHISGLSDKERAAMDFCDKLVNDSVCKVRQIANKLMPTVLDDFGLVKAIDWLIREQYGAASLQVGLNHPNTAFKINKMTEVVIYRLIEDLINYSQKHSQATKTDIVINKKDDTILMTYIDSGCKFDHNGFAGGLDLAKHKKRIAALNGFLEYSSPHGQGIKVQVKVNCTMSNNNPKL